MALFGRLLKRLKLWVEGFAEKPYARMTVFLHSFADSSFFPVSIDVTFVPIAVSRPKRAFQFAIWSAIGSVLGALFAYYIGFELMEIVGRRIIEFYNAEEQWTELIKSFQGDVANTSLLIASLTPIPFALATIAAGAMEMNLKDFIIISVLGRMARFIIMAFLIYYLGPAVKEFIDKYYELIAIIFFILLIVTVVVLIVVF